MQSIKEHIKIGITQRSIIHKEYHEHRDTLFKIGIVFLK